MIDTYSQIARWERYDKRAEEWLPADPPGIVASVHLSRAGFWKLPPIAGVITTPTLRPDGSILLEPGYDRATRLYYVPDPTLRMPKLIAKPGRLDAEAALDLLAGLLANFPFTSDVSRAVGLSMLITPVVRGALSVAPLHAAKASTAGTGKSYLVDLASAISTGRPCPVAAAATNPEETEKRLVRSAAVRVPDRQPRQLQRRAGRRCALPSRRAPADSGPTAWRLRHRRDRKSVLHLRHGQRAPGIRRHGQANGAGRARRGDGATGATYLLVRSCCNRAG